MITYVVPTRDRPGDLARTLAALGRLSAHTDLGVPGEVVIVDNASRVPPIVPNWLPNGLAVRLIFERTNRGAAARNTAAYAARPDTRWLVMLDDDSHPDPSDGGHGLIETLHAAPDDLAAIGADIHLSDGPAGPRGREAGGLPEVIVGCGAAIRRDAFLEARGYDPAFVFYAEEYDLCAKLIARGHRIEHSLAWRVVHHKAAAGRDMNAILERLVRNNAWVMARHAPDDEFHVRLSEVFDRYRAIALKEDAVEGYERGAAEARETIGDQPRAPLTRVQWDRFTGLAAARAGVRAAHDRAAFATASVVARGKHDWAVEQALRELGVSVADGADVSFAGTLSPGPRRDAVERGATCPLGESVVERAEVAPAA